MICMKKHEELAAMWYKPSSICGISSQTKADAEEVGCKLICNICCAKHVIFLMSNAGCHLNCIRR